VIGTLAGDYLSAGISFRIGGTREPALPAAGGAKPQPPGTTRLTIRAPNAQRVEIAGDFNEWTPRAATRAANGVWYADLTIPPGQYRYAFRVNGSEWRVPDGATAVEDGFGGKSAWLTVSNARSR
jgi:1,4-alpha-glucan branching enzyme